jgi:hypothetical protein
VRRLWPVLPLAACSPTQPILGSYFPSWLLCVLAGVVATAVVHQLLALAGLTRSLLLPPLTYAAMAAGAAMAVWLVLFGA